MKKITVTGNETIRIGRTGENRAVQIIWPGLLEKWRELYGDGTVQLAARRPKDTAPYPVVCEIRENDVVWTVQAADTEQYGIGECELTYLVGEVVAKSQTWATEIFRSLTYEEMIEPPDDPSKTWFTEIRKEIGNLGDLKTDEKSNLVEAINEVSQSSEGIGTSDHTKLKNRDAADQHPMSAITGLEMALKGKQPVGNYLTHDDLQSVTNAVLTQAKESGEFDGAAGQDGITPTIGDNGNWYLGDTDTGKPSRGETGPAGADGRDGTDGAAGQPGTDGKSAYQYAVEGGYTGTETEFAAKLAQEKFANPNALTFTGAVTGSYDGSAAVSVEIPIGGSGGEPTIIFDSGEITEEVNLIGPIDISKYSKLRIFGKAYPSENSAGKRAMQLYFGGENNRLLCNAGYGKLFDTSGNPVSFLIYLHIGANALSTVSFSGFNASGTFDNTSNANSSQAISSDGGCLIYNSTYNLTKMYLSAQNDLVARPWGVGTRIMVIGDD